MGQVPSNQEGECVSPESNPIQAGMTLQEGPASQKSEQKVGLETQVGPAAGLNLPVEAEQISCPLLPIAEQPAAAPAIRVSAEPAAVADGPLKNPRRSSTYRDSGDWLEQLAKMSRDPIMSPPQISSLLNKPRTMSSPQLDYSQSGSRLLSQSPEKGPEKHCFDSLWRCRKVDTQSKSLNNGK